MNTSLRYLLAICLLGCAVSTTAAPRLVLQLTVDGLRADFITRYADNFGPGGFRYLQDNGIAFSDAHYLHANTETIVGHTTLATGATPAVHGMVGNVWYHADSGELGYNIEDASAPLIATREESSAGAQVDPAQKRARTSGRSPAGILVPTFSDTLSIATAGQAKVFGISGKDRSAVAMAGKSGIAYWYSTDNGDFQSSRYYMERYPDWVTSWNGQRKAEAFGGKQWELMHDVARYTFGEQDDRPYEVDLKGYGRTFPHNFGPAEHPLFYTRLLVSPEGDRLLLDFAKSLIQSESIGQDEVTDYLSVSFSGIDAVNHFFGPSSLENEDAMLQLDRTLAALLEYVDEKVGLDNTLIVLSADHGMAEMPEYASELGYPAKRLYSDEVLAVAGLIAKDLFGTEDIVRDFFRPYLYLDAEVMSKKRLDRHSVASAIAAKLEEHPGINGALSSHNLAADPLSGAAAAVQHNQHSLRSGDIYVFQQPYWFLFDRGAVAAMHGSPWAYDTHVPIIFAGPGIEPATVNRRVHPIDVAPTLSALLQIPSPAAAQGKSLTEVIGNQLSKR
ncbi:MAG: alkaline phosphatase family protein [Halieaceae bacterium]